MSALHGLFSNRLVVGRSEERLSYLAPRLPARGAHHIVVLHEDGRTFFGLLQLNEILAHTQPGSRLLADLVGSVRPLIVRPDETVVQVADLFAQHQLNEAVVVGFDGTFLGLITSQSVLEWSTRERRRTESALRTALEAGHEAARAKEDFLAALSHELRTPLHPALLVASENATRADLPEEVRHDFATIARHVSLESKLIDDLLELSRVAHGRHALVFRPLDAFALLRQSLDEITRAAIHDRTTLDISLPLHPGMISAEPAGLRSVFLNVVSLALCLAGAGGRVRVLGASPAENAALTVTVAASGLGFEPAELPRAFEPFAPAPHRTGHPSPPGGLGVGLALARALIELHGGAIWAESGGRSAGTTFFIRLPLLDPHDNPPPAVEI